jgi:hypothetical protein
MAPSRSGLRDIIPAAEQCRLEIWISRQDRVI